MRAAAASDHRAAMGMLDARPVAGDAGLVMALRSQVLADWRRDARQRVEEVRAARLARIERVRVAGARGGARSQGVRRRDCATA